jgi:hypothetical protein
MLPLYAARIEDLGQGDFVKVDCAACHHVALLAPEFLLRLGLSPQTKVLDLKGRVRCRGCGKRAGGGFDQVGAGEQVSRPLLPAPSSHRDDADRSGHVDRLYTVVEDDAEAGSALGLRPGPGAERSTKRRLPNFTGRSVRLPATTGYAPKGTFVLRTMNDSLAPGLRRSWIR